MQRCRKGSEEERPEESWKLDQRDSEAQTDKQHLVDVADQNPRRYSASVAYSGAAAGTRPRDELAPGGPPLSGLALGSRPPKRAQSGMSSPGRGTVTTAGKSSVRRRVVPPSYLAGTATPARRTLPGRAW